MADEDLPIITESQWNAQFSAATGDDLPVIKESEFNQLFSGSQKFAGGIANMIPFNAGDEIMAGIRSVVDAAQGQNIKDAYSRNLDQIRGYEKAFQGEHPVLAPVSAIAGSAPVVVAAPTGISQELTWGQRLGQSAIEGAGWGGAYGFGAGEGGAENRLREAGKQALIGEVLSPAITGSLDFAGWLASLPGKTSDAVTSIFRTPEDIAAAKLQPSAEKILSAVDDASNPLSQYRTLAEATQDPYLAQLEQQVGKTSPVANELLAGNRAARKDAQLELLKSISSAPTRTADEGGVTLRQILEPEAQANKEAAEKILADINPGGALPVGDVNRSFTRSLNTMYEAGGAPSSLTGIKQELSHASAPPKTEEAQSLLVDQFGRDIAPEAAPAAEMSKPFSYMHSLRQRAQDAYVAARNVGDNRAAATANGLVRDVDSVIKQAGETGRMSAADAVKFEEFKNKFADFSRTYRDGPVGMALRKLGEGNYQYGESSVPGMLFNGKAETTKKLLDALPKESADALEQTRGIVRDKIIRETVNNDGFLSPGKYQTYLRKNREGLTAVAKDGRRLFEPEHIDTVEQIADDLAFLDPQSSRSVRSLAYQASHGQPTTAQALLMDMVGKGADLAPGGRLLKPFIGSFIESKQAQASDLLAKALMDKNLAKALVLKATPQRVSALRSFFDGTSVGAGEIAASAPAALNAILSPVIPRDDVPAESRISNAPLTELKSKRLEAPEGRVSSSNPTNVFSLNQAAKYPVFAKLSSAVEQVESGGKANAVSAKGAVGLMQVTPIAAREVLRAQGVNDKQYTNAQLSEMLKDPAVNKQIGDAYLKMMLDRFGDPEIALAAFNAGPTAVDKVWDKGDTFADIKSALPRETQLYVPKVTNVFQKA